MNPQDRNKYIALGVLVLAAIGVVIYQNTRTPEFVSGPGATQRPATDRSATPAPRAAATTPAPGSAFVQTDVDIDQLLDSVQEVDFNYDLERLTRNPMTPLTGRPGDVAPVAGPGTRADSPALAIARSMVITGILYDENEPIAVLENKTEQQVDVVNIGHEFPIGILVESIEESRVVLRVGDMRIPKLLEEQ